MVALPTAPILTPRVVAQLRRDQPHSARWVQASLWVEALKLSVGEAYQHPINFINLYHSL